jgi:8-oxo-dGTP diphosphatase
MGVGRFLGMVGTLLWRPADGCYLILRRSDDKDFAAGVWECVTGRVDQGESFTEAVHREVEEELGVEVQIDFIVGTVHFYRGEALPENEMLGVQYCSTLHDADAVRMSWEHAEMRWISVEEAADLFPAGHWLGDSIRRAELIRHHSAPELLAHYRAHGFEF